MMGKSRLLVWLSWWIVVFGSGVSLDERFSVVNCLLLLLHGLFGVCFVFKNASFVLSEKY